MSMDVLTVVAGGDHRRVGGYCPQERDREVLAPVVGGLVDVRFEGVGCSWGRRVLLQKVVHRGGVEISGEGNPGRPMPHAEDDRVSVNRLSRVSVPRIRKFAAVVGSDGP